MDDRICKEGRELVLLSNFVIWRERCNWLFKGKLKPIKELVYTRGFMAMEDYASNW